MTSPGRMGAASRRASGDSGFSRLDYSDGEWWALSRPWSGIQVCSDDEAAIQSIPPYLSLPSVDVWQQICP